MDSSYSVLLSVDFVKENPEDLSKRTENAEFPFQSLWKPKKFRYFSISLLTKKRGYVIIKYKLGRTVQAVFFHFLRDHSQMKKQASRIAFLFVYRAGGSPHRAS